MPILRIVEKLKPAFIRQSRWRQYHSLVVLGVRAIASVLVVVCAFLFGFFPAVTTTRVVFSSSLRQRGQIDDLNDWFSATQRRYDRWAVSYLASQRGTVVRSDDVAATEWPMFGSVFYLLSAEELLQKKQIALAPELQVSLNRAAQVIADPASGTWVRKKWGPQYLEKENVFYRMLVMLGLDAYGKITGNRQYNTLVEGHAQGLLRELTAAPYHVLDDYPGECYPSDVVWATAAIARVDALSKSERERLAHDLMETLSGKLSDKHGIPATLVDSRSGTIFQPARGCSTSGLLSFAHELEPRRAEEWYRRYEAHFWTENRWRVGFREHPIDTKVPFTDVDSGPILFGVGTAASLFGIGAARVAGRFDHAAPLTMEAVAAAWPTPFGLLVPGIMGWAATDSWCLGETAFLFAMTRANHSGGVVAFKGSVPLAVAGFIVLYWAIGVGLLYREWSFWRGWKRKASK